VNQADDDVGYNIAGPGFKIRPIGHIRLIFFPSLFANKLRFFAVFVPQCTPIRSKKITVIFEQFFQTGTGNIHQLDFHFFGSS